MEDRSRLQIIGAPEGAREKNGEGNNLKKQKEISSLKKDEQSQIEVVKEKEWRKNPHLDPLKGDILKCQRQGKNSKTWTSKMKPLERDLQGLCSRSKFSSKEVWYNL